MPRRAPIPSLGDFSSLGFSSSFNLYGTDKQGNRSPPVRHKKYFGLKNTRLDSWDVLLYERSRNSTPIKQTTKVSEGQKFRS